MARIMLVDDEVNVLKALRRLLYSEEHVIESFTEPLDAIERLKSESFDVVVSDYRMPGIDGIALLTECLRSQPAAARIILSAYTDKDALLGAINTAKIFRFISKPWDDEEVKGIINAACNYHQDQIEAAELVDKARLKGGQATVEDVELKRLERESPGITKVERDWDGSIIIEDEDI